MIEARFHPLGTWPGKRTPASYRKPARFKLTLGRTYSLLESELNKLGATNIQILAGFTLDQIRNDGWPRSTARRPSDPGVILSFQGRKGALSFPCDRYTTWEDNLRAIALSLEALRAVDRYGVTQQSEQYRGWQQLPPASSAAKSMDADLAATILAGYSVFSAKEIIRDPGKRQEAYRQTARATHPDAGGSHEAFVQVQEAMRVLEALNG